MLKRLTPFLLAIGVLVLSAPAAASAAETGPQWTVTSVSAPTNFTPGNMSGEDAYEVTVTNTGGAASDGEPVTVSDVLPDGLTLAPAGASGVDQLANSHREASGAKFKCTFAACTFTGVVVPEDTLVLTFPVDVVSSEPGSVTNVVRVAGGGAPDASVSAPTVISETPAGFGVAPGGGQHGVVELTGRCAPRFHDFGRV